MNVNPGVEAGPVDQPRRVGALSMVAWAVGFGMISGTMELAVFLAKCRWLDPRNVNVSRHYPWMFPSSGVLVLIGPGLVLAVAARLWPRRVTPTVVLGGLAFVGYIGVLFRAPIYTTLALILAAGLAFRTARFLGGRVEAFDRFARLGVVVMTGLLAAAAGASLGREAWLESRAEARRPAISPGSRSKNVILIVMDTVRAGSLGLYGYPRDTSPHLAKLADRGVRFDRAFATAPWTAPSHASMFTGRWPHEMSIGWDRPLGTSVATMAEALGDRGYATAGFVANTTYCSYETGLDRGFAHYEDYDVTPRSVLLCSALVQRTLNFAHKHPAMARRLGDDPASAGDRKDAARINRDFLGWLDGHRGRPFFAFLNYYDAHHPYLSPGTGSGTGDGFGRKPASPGDFRLLKTWWERDKRRASAGEVELARDSYDRCIAYLDGQLGRLFGELERLGVLQDSMVIVTADHGENLGERRLFGHGVSVYRPELHVPLLVIDPGGAPEGRVVNEPVSLRDLPATILGQLGLPSGFPGRSLSRTWTSIDPSTSSEPVLSEVVAPPDDDPNKGESPAVRGPLRSLVDRDYHYIRDGAGREELYDLGNDPREERDLAGRPDLAEALRRYRGQLPR